METWLRGGTRCHTRREDRPRQEHTSCWGTETARLGFPTAPQAPLSPIDNRGVTNIHEVAIKDALIRSQDALIARQATFLKELMDAQRRLKRGARCCQ